MIADIEDWRRRFQIEYEDLANRLEKLDNMLGEWDRGDLTFKPKTSRFLFDIQRQTMWQYLSILKLRASIEGIELPDFGKNY